MKRCAKAMGDKQVTRIRTAKALHDKSATNTAKQPLPTRVPVHPLLQLQRQIGNQAVTRLIQAKLTIGEPGDKYEQEADRVASLVVSQINAPTPQQSSQGQTVQRLEMPEDEKLQTKPEVGSIQRQEMPEDEKLQTKLEVGSIQRQEMPEDEKLQTKPMVQRQPGGDRMAATPQLEASIQQARGGGQPLSERIRKPMEQAFGADFSGVRVHTDTQSDELNQSIQAKAFTTGQDIFFRQGEYDPENRKELIAHELTHVVQQSGEAVQRKELGTEASQQNNLINEKPGGIFRSGGLWQPVIQRRINELWNFDTDKPNKKALRQYSSVLPTKWAWVNNETLADSIVTHLIKTLTLKKDLETLVQTTQITKEVYEHYKNDNILSLVEQINLNATTQDLQIAIERENGTHIHTTSDNLKWWYAKYPGNVRLSWSKWFPYTKNNTWNPPTQDPEISVKLGVLPWGRIHIHYGRYQDAKEENIEAIHIKPLFGDDRSSLEDEWKAHCQAIVNNNLASRPAMQ